MKRLIFALLFSVSLHGAEILSLGDAIMDHIVFVDEAFVQSISGKKGGSALVDLETFEKLLCRKPIKRAGGAASNSSKVLADLGHDCAVIGKIGNDKEGKQFIHDLKKRGVASFFSILEASTGRSACLITPDGERTMRTFLGILTTSENFTLDRSAFKGINHFHFAGYQFRNMDLLKEALTYAKEEKATISMDMASFEIVEDYRKEILELLASDIDLVFCNRDEGKKLTGLAPEKACQELAKICQIAVVTTGADGGYVASKEKCFHYTAHCTNPIDSTGAGDHFLAGFLHGFLKDQPLEICAQYGATISGRIVRVVGADMPKKAWTNLSKSLASIEKTTIRSNH